MEKLYNIYYLIVKEKLSIRINILTDSIEDERKMLAKAFGVKNKDIVFKIKHLKDKWSN